MNQPVDLEKECIRPLLYPSTNTHQGMQEYERTVVVTTEKLLQLLRENREKFQEIYRDAYETWQAELKAAATAYAEDPLNGDLFARLTTVRNSRPTNYDKEYHNAIQQFSFETRKEVQLPLDEARCFLSDDWEWNRNAMSNQYFSASFQKLSKER